MKSTPGSPSVKPFSTRNVLRVLYVTGALLLIPLASMLLGGAFNWGVFDFVAAAVLLAGTGVALEFARARLRSRTSRMAAGAVIVLALLIVWAELAVGIFH
ncbi:hypothetical protein [Pseudoduganella umbonata]|uniref:Uncharacterized protein n=1 Tax=Pseudoduganella umbonata TaxID=864828 RepID=A0A4P8HM30_9BURK|nr:hypothetical protein [Pseudoduganella umbonata]MBB3219243.1 hypothetical protein [Pseudoduganella umbonata]QCP09360.1 hypothetical protein FCL38_02160 [Pseudoduganella umbonata]